MPTIFSGGTTENIVGTYDDEGVLLPDGPGTLGDFDGSQVNGVWTLTVSDQANVDVGSLNSWALKIVSAGTVCPQRHLAHDFPLTTNPGWTTQGQWAYGQPTGGGSHNLDPTSGYTGLNVYGYNLAGDYPNSMATTQYLTTTAINCRYLASAQLRFRRRLGVESATYDHASIQVSNNGTTWTTVYNHTGAAVSESAWSLQSYNIAAVADGQQTVYLRWGMGPTDTSVTYPGWNIDDVQIWALCSGVTPGDADLNGVANGLDVKAFTDGVMNPSLLNAQQFCALDANGDGVVNDLDIDPFANAVLTAP